MKRVLLFAVLVLACRPASAELIDRGNGLIYDTDQNLTWLKDANYAATQYFRSGGRRGDQDGLMEWATANAWARSLFVGGYNDWRLPAILDLSGTGCDFAYTGTDCGYNTDVTVSEISYMFHKNLGNVSVFDETGKLRGGTNRIDWGLVNHGPFKNLYNGPYWTSVELSPYPVNAWSFLTHDGFQHDANKKNRFYAWAVRTGDVTPSTVEVPVPAPTVIR